MKIKPFFPVFVALVVVVAYAWYAAEKTPDGAFTLTPKEYIQKVEREKAERRNEHRFDEGRSPREPAEAIPVPKH